MARAMSKRRTFGGGGPLVYCLAAVVAALTLGPVAYGALGGFRSNEQLARDPAGLPDPWVFSNYSGVFSNDASGSTPSTPRRSRSSPPW